MKERKVLWSGRFGGEPRRTLEFTSSLAVDRLLARYDLLARWPMRACSIAKASFPRGWQKHNDGLKVLYEQAEEGELQ